MHKTYFHNSKLVNENKDIKKKPHSSTAKTKRAVDINILLNRVKVEQKTETKRKIIFYSFSVLVIGLLGTFITIIK